MPDFDVIVVGAGNAALAAANSAREEGAGRVLVLEKASEPERGGNTWFSGGLLRIAYGASRALEPLLPDVEARLPGFFDNVEPYTEEDFLSDLRRVTAGRADPMLARILIENSYQTIRWMHEAAGVPMEAAVSLAGIRVGNKVKFQKGAIVRARQEGIGLSRSWFARTERNGIEIRYETGALSLLRDRSGRHSTPISNEWPDFADRKRTDKSNRLSYPFGVMVNRAGRRFVDEGEDLGFYTYAKYGGEILRQPGSLAWQIFDRKTMHLLEPRYRTSEPITSDTLEGLVEQIDIDDRAQALRTLDAYNEAACDRAGFDPTVLDGLATTGLDPPKSNWALRLDEPPFAAYSATGGITFTFGGLAIDEQARVLGTDWRPMPGLYTCGEMVGGLFHFNYPGGTGLVSGAVFGRIAGRSAARDRAGS